MFTIIIIAKLRINSILEKRRLLLAKRCSGIGHKTVLPPPNKNTTCNQRKNLRPQRILICKDLDVLEKNQKMFTAISKKDRAVFRHDHYKNQEQNFLLEQETMINAPFIQEPALDDLTCSFCFLPVQSVLLLSFLKMSHDVRTCL